MGSSIFPHRGCRIRPKTSGPPPRSSANGKQQSPLITPSIFCHSPYTCCDKTLSRAKAAAVDEGVLFQIHVAETREEITADGTEHRTDR